MDGIWANQETPDVGSSGLKLSRNKRSLCGFWNGGKDRLDLALVFTSSLDTAVVIFLSEAEIVI